MIHYLQGVPATFRKLARDFFTKTIFFDVIALVELPHKFVSPRFRTYDGTTDLDVHISHYH